MDAAVGAVGMDAAVYVVVVKGLYGWVRVLSVSLLVGQATFPLAAANSVLCIAHTAQGGVSSAVKSIGSHV